MILRPKIFFIALLFIFPFAVNGQVKQPIKIVRPDTVKPRPKDSLDLQVDTASFWKDSLIREPIRKEGDYGDDEVKKRPRRRKFKYRFSDRIQYAGYLSYPFASGTAIPTSLLLHKELCNLEEQFWEPSWWTDSTNTQVKKSVPKRIFRTLLVDLTVETFMAELQQNFLGQYLRALEFRMSGLKYSMKSPIPFWQVPGKIDPTSTAISNEFSRQQIAQVSSAAMEANHLISDELSMRWMLRQGMFYREALHYLRNQTAVMAGIFTMNNNNTPGTNPYKNWLYYTNREYGHMDEIRYDSKELKRDYAIASLTNPFLYTSVYHLFYSYTRHSLDSLPLFSINLGRNRWAMPWLSLNLTPYGPEWMPQLALTKNRQGIMGYARIGSGNYVNSYGGGIKLFNAYRDEKLRIDGHATIWKQQYLYRNWNHQESMPIYWGGALTVTGTYKLKETDFPMSLVVQAGYKTQGYMEGEVWNRTPILKVGLSFALDRDFEQEDVVPEYEFVPTRKEMRKNKMKSRNASKKAAPRTPK